MELKSSLKINAILNGIKSLLQVIFPLITFPYVSRVLGVEYVGKYNFATSIVNYFLLLAALGISTYAVREGARKREDKRIFNNFAGEIFTINIISTVVSYLLLLGCLLTVRSLSSYKNLIFILSLQIFFTTIGVEWIYVIYEDYFFITIRNIAFQIVSLVLLFVFVHTPDDLNKYALLTVISGAGANIINLVYSRKYCQIKLIFNRNLISHIKPVFILFGMAVTVTIYVNSDITILGFFCGEFTVGIYSVSVKIYTVLKSISSALLVVSIPRISAMIGEGNGEKIEVLGNSIYKTFVTYIMPIITGIIILRKEIILIVSGENYLAATSSLALLSLALFVCIGAGFWSQCVMIPLKMEKTVFFATLLSAVINIGLNFVLIPVWEEKAAAITTIIAEGIVFIICRMIGRKHIAINGMREISGKIILGCCGMILITEVIRRFALDVFPFTILVIICSIIVYGVIEVILKNEVVYDMFNVILRKITEVKKRG